MEAVIIFKGVQIPVKVGQRIILPYAGLREGEEFEAEVLMKVVDGKSSFQKGKAKLKVLGEKKERTLVFKMKRKKNYRRMYEHVQRYTVALVEGID